MEFVFLKLFNMSICAGWLILVVLLLRFILKKVPGWVRCVLWGIVAVRLLCPFSIESIFSLIPSAETLTPYAVQFASDPELTSGISTIDNALNPFFSRTFTGEPLTSVNSLYVLVYIASYIWLVGMLILSGYALLSYLKTRSRVQESIPFRDNILLCDTVESPFILGVIRPRIYLSSSMEEKHMNYVIAHEQAHLKRKDHWWKPLGFLLLNVYWFNPLVWAAFVLFCRDIELACDEKVIRDFDMDSKKVYSHALVSCSVQRKAVFACPLAFGETGVKERVNAVLKYKKPAAGITVAGMIICIAISVCFLTNPKNTAVHGASITENLPYYSPENVSMISIEAEYPVSDKENMVSRALQFQDESWISDFLAILSRMEMTKKTSIQDYPQTEAEVITIRIFFKNDKETTLFYYEENGTAYVEEPYVGIFTAPDELAWIISGI